MFFFRKEIKQLNYGRGGIGMAIDWHNRVTGTGHSGGREGTGRHVDKIGNT